MSVLTTANAIQKKLTAISRSRLVTLGPSFVGSVSMCSVGKAEIIALHFEQSEAPGETHAPQFEHWSMSNVELTGLARLHAQGPATGGSEVKRRVRDNRRLCSANIV